jgi:hypothetical protein
LTLQNGIEPLRFLAIRQGGVKAQRSGNIRRTGERWRQ